MAARRRGWAGAVMRWALPMLAALFTLLPATPAAADELRPGYLSLTQSDATHWRLVWRLPRRGGIGPAAEPVLPQGCAITGNPERLRDDFGITLRARVLCDGPVGGKRIGIAGMATNSADVLVRVAPLGGAVQALRVTAARPMAEIAAETAATRADVARTYFVIGVEHIIGGFDHLLFVISLVLLIDGLWTVAKAVTAFTIAHSLTLAGTTLGLFGLPQAPVEAVIALSIMFLAVEIAKAKPGEPRLSQRVPWLVAFAFGLLHGFGFAGALREVGLPDGEVPMALLTFNLGVEAGQIAVVLATAALLAAGRRFLSPAMPVALRLASYAIGITSAYWLIERMIMA